jgi:hypothetical protein
MAMAQQEKEPLGRALMNSKGLAQAADSIHLSLIKDHSLDLKRDLAAVLPMYGLHGRPHFVQTFLEFLPIQKFASVNMVAVKQQIEAA